MLGGGAQHAHRFAAALGLVQNQSKRERDRAVTALEEPAWAISRSAVWGLERSARISGIAFFGPFGGARLR
jgi:hypothetical protein